MSQDPVERSAKLDVEDCVDERVEKAVDVAEPDEERKEPEPLGEKKHHEENQEPRRQRRMRSAAGGAVRDEEREDELVDVTESSVVEQVVPDTDGVDDVDCEERNPTEHEHA